MARLVRREVRLGVYFIAVNIIRSRALAQSVTPRKERIIVLIRVIRALARRDNESLRLYVMRALISLDVLFTRALRGSHARGRRITYHCKLDISTCLYIVHRANQSRRFAFNAPVKDARAYYLISDVAS